MVIDSWGNTANGAVARQAAWNGGNNQQWRLNDVGNGRYQIINRGTGTALDGMGNSHRRLHRRHVGAQHQHQQPVDHHGRVTAGTCSDLIHGARRDRPPVAAQHIPVCTSCAGMAPAPTRKRSTAPPGSSGRCRRRPDSRPAGVAGMRVFAMAENGCHLPDRP